MIIPIFIPPTEPYGSGVGTVVAAGGGGTSLHPLPHAQFVVMVNY